MQLFCPHGMTVFNFQCPQPFRCTEKILLICSYTKMFIALVVDAFFEKQKFLLNIKLIKTVFA